MKRLVNHQRSIVALCLVIWLSLTYDASAQTSPADLFGTFPEIQLLPPGGNLQSGIQAYCPSDITLQATNGMNGAFVTWDPIPVETTCKGCSEIPMGTQLLESWNGHRYFVSNGLHNWPNALQFAIQASMDLAAINSPPENSFLHTQNPGSAYTGGNNIGNNGLFQWSNGDVFSYQNWSPGQPGPNIFTEYAILKQTDGMWYAIPPQENHIVLLESSCLTATLTQGLARGSFFPIGTTTVTYEISDLCGNKTACTFNVTVECNLTLDCPVDISVNCETGQNGAHVSWNLPEVHSCCNLCLTDTVKSGFIYMGKLGGSTYFCSKGKASWQYAKTHSAISGGYLVAINAIEENNFLANQLAFGQAWIGLTDEASEGHFSWVNGEPLSYTNWQIGQPDNGVPGSEEDYGALSPSGFWYDEKGTENREYIMEIPCIHLTQISGPPSGSFFQSGVTSITYKAWDACGDTTYCSFKVIVPNCCEESPQINCPPNYYACPDTPMHPSVTGYATSPASADSCGNILITYTDETLWAGNCWDKIIKRTWTASYTANPGAATTCQQTLTLKDELPPTILGCPNDITAQPDPNCHACIFWTPPTATDNCSGVTISASHPPGFAFPAGVTTVTYTFTDACSNSSYCSFKITVLPCCEPPQISCPPNYSACPDTPINPSVTGNATSITPCGPCGNVIISYTDSMLWAGNCWDKIVKRTWTASYDTIAGVSTTCQQTITLKDDLPPVIVFCPDDITTQPNQDCHACIFWTPPTANDNCSGVTVSASHQPGFAFPEGVTTVTYTFTDACGNSSKCSFKITVLPCCEPPQISCPPNYYACPDTPINPSVTGYATSITQCGPCGNVIISYTDSMLWAGNCWDKIVKRTWTASYDVIPGVSTTCQQTITLKDESPPTIAGCPSNITAQPDSNCHACIFWTPPTVTDSCSGVTVSASHQPGFAFPEGVTTVTYTFTDACGNSSYCTFKITVLPCCEPPVVICPSNYSGCPETSIDPVVTGYATSPTPSGSCGDINLSYQDSLIWTGPCWDKIILRTWKATYDQNPNLVTTCQQTITLQDDQAPVFSLVPDHLTICPGEPINFTTPTVSDECGTATLTYMDVYLPGSCKTGEKHTRTWTATDACGNQSFILNTITVKDNDFPLFNPCPSDITVSPGADCKATVLWDDLIVSDNCGSVTVDQTHFSGDIFEEGATTVTYTATDLCGNISVCKFKITVEECCTPPGLKCPPKNMGCPGDPFGPEITGEPELIGFSNCGLLDLTYEDFISDTIGCPDAKAIARIWTLTVVSQPNKISTCEQWIMRRDNEAPEFDQCPEDIIIYTDKWCPIKVDWQEPVITDHCSSFEVETTHLNGDTYFPGTTTVQYFAEDECGNISFCFFDIVIIYSGAPPEGGYCLSYGEKQEMLWIDSIYLNESLILSGEKCGVGFADAREHVLAWGEEVSMKVIPELGMPGSAGYLRAWVDWDGQDGFDPGDEMIYHAQIPDGEPTTIKFNVPHTAPTGKSRIRVSYKHLDWDSDPMPPLPCSIFKEGSVADILIQIEVASSTGYVLNESELQLFPNPTRDQVSIRSDLAIPHAAKYEIFNMLGQSVRSGVLEEGSTLDKVIDLQGIPSGVYRFLTWENGTIRHVLPLVIE